MSHVHIYSPPPSPPSSPAPAWDRDSSPSPSIIDLTSSVSESSFPPSPPQRIIDPLAAAYNSKDSKRDSSCTLRPKRAWNAALTTTQAPQPAAIKKRAQADDLEYKIWEEASNKVFESGCKTIDLSDHQLTGIPAQFIHDLNKMIVLPGVENSSIGSPFSAPSAKPDATAGGRLFTRVQTAPTSSFRFRGPNSWGKSVSTNSFLSGNSKDAVQLFLAKNNISQFPLELSRLENLTILSLHHNFISYLPPEIARLKKLRTLNVCNNKLKFIPSELLEMKLHSLLLFPNPFISPPLSPRPISEVEYVAHKVPSLTELALRVLLSHPTSRKSALFSSSADMPETLLEQRFDLPLPVGASWCPISPLLRKTLSICVPGSVLSDESLAISSSDDESTPITGIGICPNPKHGPEKKVFVTHVEQRLTWERRVAEVDIGGAVPVRWRGCQRGCLDFLCPSYETEFFGGLDDVADVDMAEFQAVQFED